MTDFDGRDPYAQWDAAYVLGALPMTERIEFEQHKAGCLRCAASVAELAGMAQLLGAASADVRLEDHSDPEPAAAGAPGSVLASVLAIGRRRRRRRYAVGAAVLAAAVSLAVLVGVALPHRHASTHAISVPLAPVTPSSVQATVYLAAEPWGTRIDVACTYEAHAATGGGSPPYDPNQSYQLVVTDRTGTSTVAMRWGPGGTTAWPIGSVNLGVNDIAKILLTTTKNVPLLQATR